MASASSSSPSFLESGDEELQTKPQQQQQSSAAAPPPAKKRRNQPGNPTDPEAEVIALSPKTLLATNRFVCEVCGKGFQREQNLQLHRRGHNLPWKLRLKSSKEVRRRVYLCPEPSCVHHDPARALGDLTGIKKHFCRKHGEKKWKCDKCSKRYAVHSDLKAHAKTCGTREYRCDCGTLFSRRDSFITHRAFCDALAQESSRLPTAGGELAAFGGHLYGNNSMSLSLSQVNAQLSGPDLLRHGSGGGGGVSRFEQLMTSLNQPSHFRPPPSAHGFFLGNGPGVQDFNGEHQNLIQSKPFHGLMQLPDLQGGTVNAGASSNLFNLAFFSSTNSSNNGGGGGGGGNNQFLIGYDEPTTLLSGTIMSDQMTSLYSGQESILPRMSATALLQKASQMGSSTTNGGGDGLQRFQIDNETNLQNLMNSLASGADADSCGLLVGGAFGGGNRQDAACRAFSCSLAVGLHDMDEAKFDLTAAADDDDDRLTRDFLGVGGILRSISGGISRRDQAPNNHGIDMSVLDPK